MLITFCGPACSGKDTIVGKLDSFKRLIQHTTRPMRPGEQEGVEYFFHKSKDEMNDPFSLKEFTVANGDKWYYWFEYDDVVKAIESDELFITISDVDGTIKFFNRGAYAIIIDVPIEERIKRYYERELKKSEPNFKEAMRRIIADIDDFQVFNNANNFFTSHWGEAAQHRIRQITNNRPIEDTINEINHDIQYWIHVSDKSESSEKMDKVKRYNMFIDVNEYQTKILDIIGSDELDKIIASSVYADNHELRMAIVYGMTIASMYTAQCTQYMFDVTKSDTSDIGGLNMKAHMVDIDTNTDVYDAIIHTSSHANISEEKDNTMTPKKWKEFKGYMHDLHEMQNECCGGCEQPLTECRECMQRYYWDNVSYYLKYEMEG